MKTHVEKGLKGARFCGMGDAVAGVAIFHQLTRTSRPPSNPQSPSAASVSGFESGSLRFRVSPFVRNSGGYIPKKHPAARDLGTGLHAVVRMLPQAEVKGWNQPFRVSPQLSYLAHLYHGPT